MSDHLSSNWLSTDEDSGGTVNVFIEKEGDSGLGNRDTGEEEIFVSSPESRLSYKARTKRGVPISSERNKKHIHFIGIGMGIIGVAALMFIFVQGVSFLQASMLQDPDIQDLPLPMLIDEGLGTRDLGNGDVENIDSNFESVIPSPESLIPNPSIPQTIHINEPSPIATVWPSILKMNRYTVGSSLVPDLSILVSVPLQIAGGKMHAAAYDNSGVISGITRAPATGPALWVLIASCLLVSPVFLVGRKKPHTAF